MLHAKDVGPWRSPGSTYFEARQRRRARGSAGADLAETVPRSECYEALRSLPQNRGSEEPVPEGLDGANVHEVHRATLPQPPSPGTRPVEELCWVGSTLIWSVGARIERTFDFGGDEGEEILQALFAFFDAPSAVASGSSAPSDLGNIRFDYPGSLHPSRQPPAAELVKGVCVFLREQVRIFCATGEEYVLHFGWTLKRAWAAHVGIICETVPPYGDDPTRSGDFIRLWCLTDPASYHFRPLFASRKVVLPRRDAAAPIATNPAASKEENGSAALPVTPLEPSKSIISCTDKSQGRHLPLVLFSIDGSADIHICAYTRVTFPEDPTDASTEAGGPAVVTAPPSPVYALRRSSRVSRKRSSASQTGVAPGRSRSSLPPSNEHALGLSTTVGERYSPDDDVQMRRRTSAAMSRRASSRGMSISGLGAREEYLGLASAANADIVGRATTHAEVEDNLSFAFDPANAPDLSEGEVVVGTLKVLQAAEVTPSDRDPDARGPDAAIFDLRGDSACLALCFPETSTTYLIGLNRLSTTIEVSTLRAISATNIAPVMCTRPHVFDLLAMRPTGEMLALTAEGLPDLKMPRSATQKAKSIEAHPEGLIVWAPSRTRIVPTARIWRLSAWSRDSLVQRILESTARQLQPTVFAPLLHYFMEGRPSTADEDDTGDLLALCRIMEACWSAADKDLDKPVPGPDPDPWLAVLSRMGSAHLDPALVGLVPEAAFGVESPAPSSSAIKRLPSTVVGNAQLRAALSAALRLVVSDLQCSISAFEDLHRLCHALQQSRIPLAGSAALWAQPLAGGLKSETTDDAVEAFDVTDAAGRLMLGADLPPWAKRALDASPFPASYYGVSEFTSRSSQILSLVRLVYVSDRREASLRAVREMVKYGWTASTMDDIPFGLALPLREALRSCRLAPPGDEQAALYALIGRPDLWRSKASPTARIESPLANGASLPRPLGEREALPVSSSCLGLSSAASAGDSKPASRFSDDMRSMDVAKMLNYSSELRLRLSESTDTVPTAQTPEQAALIASYARRTMALPYGSAAFLHKTSQASAPTVPSIKCSARCEPEGVIFQADPARLEGFAWPRFHCGVAAALELTDDTDAMESPFLRLEQPDDLEERHAGYLLGLGLNGHLSSASRMQIFRYLDPKHEMTSIAILIGLSATFLGTGDPKVASVLAAHVPALYPEQATHLNVSPLTQCAGLVGFGLLHLGTGRRQVAKSMLRELLKTERVSIDAPESNRATYCLSAAVGYGFVMLGKGATLAKEVRADLTRTFKHLMHGDATRPLPGVNEGPGTVDTSVTGPAATLALAMVYLKSHQEEAAALCVLPATRRRLDAARPLALLLRTCARCLIMWDDIDVSPKWIAGLVPPFLLQTIERGDSTVDIAYWNIVAGACLAMGLRFAGSASADAHATLIELYDRAMRTVTAPATSFQAKIRRASIRMCASTLLLALSLVMAGTGELQVLRRLRTAHGTVSDAVNHGNHVATHLALGFLFLGKGQSSFGTSNVAIASLLCSLYPVFPATSDDQTHHLQPLRHLWALAVEPRCIIARDVDRDGVPVFLPLKLRVKGRDPAAAVNKPTSKSLIAPTLLPAPDRLLGVKVDSPRYWPVSLDAESIQLRSSHLRNRTLWVKRKIGHVDYFRDPRGVQSIATRGQRTEGPANAAIDDFGRSARLARARLPFGSRAERAKTSDSHDDFDLTPAVAALAQFLSSLEPEKGDDFTSFIAGAMVQSLVQDKLEALPTYLALFWAARAPASAVSLALQAQIALLDGPYAKSATSPIAGAPRPPLVDPTAISYAMAQLAAGSRRWLETEGGEGVLIDYLRGGDLPGPGLDALQLAGACSLHRLPPLASIDVLKNLVRQTLNSTDTRAEGDTLSALKQVLSVSFVADEAVQAALLSAI